MLCSTLVCPQHPAACLVLWVAFVLVRCVLVPSLACFSNLCCSCFVDHPSSCLPVADFTPGWLTTGRREAATRRDVASAVLGCV
jgi:hypothetical protein